MAQHGPVTERMYTDLAAWWPLISAPEEYLEEAAEALRHLRSAQRPVREVLELGSGGGNNAVHLAAELELTLVDLSTEMLAVSRRLNPRCAHVVGDMRTVRLDRTFDAVFLHDAVDYMVTTDDLAAALTTAFVHCRPGGVVVVMPDATTEIWEPGTDHGGHDAPGGRAARYLSWDWDPEPDDQCVATEYAFVLRAADGRTEVVHETHHTGLFDEATWLRLLGAAGFEAHAEVERTDDDRRARAIFVAHRPAEIGDRQDGEEAAEQLTDRPVTTPFVQVGASTPRPSGRCSAVS
jgi:SAM-dependent methyltransferase